MSFEYEDIINLKRPVSKKHTPMSRADRAAQFSPFAALTGLDEAVTEASRQTGEKITISSDEQKVLDEKLSLIAAKLSERPLVTLTYFKPDLKKEGGEYVTESVRIKSIDEISRTVKTEDSAVIALCDIIDIEGDFFDRP